MSNDPVMDDKPMSNDPVMDDKPKSSDPDIDDKPMSNDPVMDDKPMSNDPVMDDKLTSQLAVGFSDSANTVHVKTCDVTVMNKGLGEGLVKRLKLLCRETSCCI